MVTLFFAKEKLSYFSYLWLFSVFSPQQGEAGMEVGAFSDLISFVISCDVIEEGFSWPYEMVLKYSFGRILKSSIYLEVVLIMDSSIVFNAFQ